MKRRVRVLAVLAFLVLPFLAAWFGVLAVPSRQTAFVVFLRLTNNTSGAPSCTVPLPTNGVGNITNAPLFVDYTNGNLRLQSNSPCINSGNNAYVTTATDLDGNPRIVSGTVDIGAYEYQGSGSVISYTWLHQYGLPTDGSADFIDSDHDDMNNWQEWICGTCPTNAQSVLRMLSATSTPTNATITWQSVAGMNYFLSAAQTCQRRHVSNAWPRTSLGRGVLPASSIPTQPVLARCSIEWWSNISL